MDVSYYHLLEDPVAQVRRVLERAGIAFAGEAVRRAELYLEAHPQNRFGRHAYGLSDFELDAATIDEDFGGYRERYGIPVE